jgi:hypothetical protein
MILMPLNVPGIRCAVVLIVLSALAETVSGTPSIQWTREFGTDELDQAFGVAADRLGNVFVTGATEGNLIGGSAAGYSDQAFLRKYNVSGQVQWTRQFGAGYSTRSGGVSADGEGNAYIAGYTYGSLVDGTSAGGQDAFLRRYDASGSLAWSNQFGTNKDDRASDVFADGFGSIYVSGTTYGNLGGGVADSDGDAFVAKYNSSGAMLWTTRFSTDLRDFGASVTADGAGNVYLTGLVEEHSTSGFHDAFLAKYNSVGVLQWSRLLNSGGHENGSGLATDAMGNVFIAGTTSGSLFGQTHAGGVYDAFIAKYNASGTRLWTRLIGSSAEDQGADIAIDEHGDAYVTGFTAGSLGGSSSIGGDAFVSKVSASGEIQWTRLWGGPYRDEGHGVSINEEGIYFAGDVGGVRNFGSFKGDALVGVLLDIPLNPADFDNNGVVNGADLTLWQSSFGTDDHADADGDGDADGADFLAWQRAFHGSNAAHMSATVPEPNCATLILLILTFGYRRRR